MFVIMRKNAAHPQKRHSFYQYRNLKIKGVVNATPFPAYTKAQDNFSAKLALKYLLPDHNCPATITGQL
ncbi:MAG: hypothetical protein E7058_08315 [Lentisphaerae bacterium]|nr:hypothetical protein [Lentisphaerota bacterium]